MMQRLGFFPYSKKKMWHREIASQWISQLRTKQALEQLRGELATGRTHVCSSLVVPEASHF